MKLFVKSKTVLILFFILVFIGCKKQPTEQSGYSYTVPEKLDDGWEVTSLDEVNINKEIIQDVTGDIKENKFKGIYGLLIVKENFLVFEEYFNGYSVNSLHEIFSITKSVTSSLIGISIDKGFINNVDDRLLSYMPQYVDDISDETMNEITLAHILTLTSGIEWDEETYSYSDPRNSETQMFNTFDWMKFVISRPVTHTPGTVYEYNTGSVHLLSAVIKNAVDSYADKFAEDYLFGPLGITTYDWNKDFMNYPCTGATHGGLRMKLRDLAKFGQLFLEKGNRNGNQIISQEWVIESTVKHNEIPDRQNDIGYLWWLGQYSINGKTVEYIVSYGYGGQTMYLVPEKDLIIIITCSAEGDESDIYIPVMMVFEAVF